MMSNSELKRQKYDTLYMDIATRISGMSTAVRLKVGSILVKDGNITSFGWNGMPSGWDNNCEDMEFLEGDLKNLDRTEIWHQWPHEGVFLVNGHQVNKRYRLKTKPEVLHAEANALMKLARTGGTTTGSMMYCTHAPCLECAKLIHQAGVYKLLYRHTYRSADGISLLERSGVEIEKFTG